MVKKKHIGVITNFEFMRIKILCMARCKADLIIYEDKGISKHEKDYQAILRTLADLVQK